MSEQQILVMCLYEGRIASLQRAVSMPKFVMFHELGKHVQDFWPAWTFGYLNYDWHVMHPKHHAHRHHGLPRERCRGARLHAGACAPNQSLVGFVNDQQNVCVETALHRVSCAIQSHTSQENLRRILQVRDTFQPPLVTTRLSQATRQ